MPTLKVSCVNGFEQKGTECVESNAIEAVCASATVSVDGMLLSTNRSSGSTVVTDIGKDGTLTVSFMGSAATMLGNAAEVKMVPTTDTVTDRVEKSASTMKLTRTGKFALSVPLKISV